MAGDPKAMELERDLAKTLRSVDAFHVHGNDLTLSSKGAVVAKFRSGK
jgi:heat shock protein HslJ